MAMAVLQIVENKHTFFTLTFVKSKLKNSLTTHLDFVVQIYAQNYSFLKVFHSILPSFNGVKKSFADIFHWLYGLNSTFLESYECTQICVYL
jgi:hypothetical protein